MAREHLLSVEDLSVCFGLPGKINLGYNLKAPENVDRMYHAMAMDMRKHFFPLTRWGNGYPWLREMWFRGDHKDIGKGPESLWWLIDSMKGIEWRTAHRPATRPAGKALPVDNPRISRRLRSDDYIHESAIGVSTWLS